MKNIIVVAVILFFTSACSGTIQGSFYSDVNSNKVKDTGEEALPYVMFKVTRDGEKIGNAITNALGEYHLKVKGGGYYCVEVIKDSTSKQSGTSTTSATGAANSQAAVTAKAAGGYGTASCYSNFDCQTGQSCKNSICTVNTTDEDTDTDTDANDDDKDKEDADNDDKETSDDTTTTTSTTPVPVKDSGKVCEQVTRNKHGLDVPIFVSFGNLTKLPKPDKVTIPLNKTRTIFFTYPELATFDKIFLPSILRPAGSAAVKNYSYNMLDLSSSPSLPIPGLAFGLDESVLTRKGIMIEGAKVGKATIEIEVEAPTGTIALWPQEVEVVAEYPNISQKIASGGKPKAGDKFKIEIDIDNEVKASLDSAELIFIPSSYAKDVTEYDGSCKNMGDKFICDLSLGDITELTRSFTITLPESFDGDKDLLFSAKLVCKVGEEEKEIPADDISFKVIKESE